MSKCGISDSEKYECEIYGIDYDYEYDSSSSLLRPLWIISCTLEGIFSLETRMHLRKIRTIYSTLSSVKFQAALNDQEQS